MQTQFSLTFGRNSYAPARLTNPHGGNVTETEVRVFLQENVTPRFDGFTFTKHEGYWRGVPEDSFTVDILANASEENREKVVRIAQEYKELFHQESVLVSESPVWFSFV